MCASTFEHLITRSYYRCNGSFGHMLHWAHGIGGTRNIVVYACPNTNRLVCENGGNCYTDTDHEDGYLDEFTLVADGMKGSGAFQCIRFIQNSDILCRTTYGILGR